MAAFRSWRRNQLVTQFLLGQHNYGLSIELERDSFADLSLPRAHVVLHRMHHDAIGEMQGVLFVVAEIHDAFYLGEQLVGRTGGNSA